MDRYISADVGEKQKDERIAETKCDTLVVSHQKSNGKMKKKMKHSGLCLQIVF